MRDRQRRRLKWPEMLAWCMAGSTLVVQARQILDRTADNTLWVHIPYVLSFLGAALVFAYSAYHSVRKRRLAWALLALATIMATVVAIIGLGTRLHLLDYSIFAPVQEGLIYLEYGLVFVAGGAFLPRRLSLLGNLSSVILDSIIVGCAFFLFSQIVLPVLFPWPLTYEAVGMRHFLALDAGVILGFGLLFIRYHKQDGSILLGMLFIALICHLLADFFYLILAWLPGSSFAFTDIAMPLYMLRNAACALGVYWSVRQPLKPITAGQLMPYFEWVAWTRISRVCLLGVAFVVAFLVPGAYAATFVIILILAALRELLSTYQERGMLVNLHAVTLQEQQANAELTKAGEQIRVALAMNQAILESIADGVIVFDESGRVTVSNPAAERLLGEVPTAGTHLVTLLEHVPERDQILQLFQQRHMVSSVKAHWGSQQVFSLSLSPVHLQSASDQVGMVVVYRDITREAEVDQLKSRLLAMVTHDLRTPLVAFASVLERLQAGAHGQLNDQQAAAVKRLEINTRRLLGLINDLLDRAQIEAGKILALHPADFSPAALLEDLQSTVGDLAQAKHLEMTIRLAPGFPVTLHGDPQRLLQILTNLVANAIKFTERGCVHVDLAPVDPGHWALQVSDTGRGIPPEERLHVFEAFQATGANAGSGLGLTIVQHLVQQMGGNLCLDSQPGQGSTFTITLPLVERAVEPGTD